jgi:hypothetical protein
MHDKSERREKGQKEKERGKEDRDGQGSPPEF